MGRPGRRNRECRMKWRVVLELVEADGTARVHEVSGGAAVAEYTPRIIGLTLVEGKHLLAAVQTHLVQAQTEDHCRRRRRCQRCGAERPRKDARSRRLVSLFGMVKGASLHAVSMRGDLPPEVLLQRLALVADHLREGSDHLSGVDLEQ